MRSPPIGVIFVLGLFALITPPTLGECPTSFYAEDVTKDDLGSLDFYFTARSVGSAADCANFCGKRQFCRTAVYDESASTCAISYGWRTSCSQTPARFNSFTPKSVGLVAVACVDFCPSDDHNGQPGRATNGPLRAAEKTGETSGTVVSVTSPSTSALAAEVSSSAASAQPTTASTAPTPTTAETAAATTARAPSTDANHIPAAEPTETTTEQSAAPTTASLLLSIYFRTAPKSTVTEPTTSTVQLTTPTTSTAQPTTPTTSTAQPTTPTSSAPTTTTVANENGSPNSSVTNTNDAKVALITAAPESLTTAAHLSNSSAFLTTAEASATTNAKVASITAAPESLITTAHLSNSSALLNATEPSATTTKTKVALITGVPESLTTAAHLLNSSAVLTSATTTSTEHTTTTYTGPAFVTESLLGQSNPSDENKKSFSPTGLGAESVPCFTFQPRRTLLNAVFATESGISLAECKCLCASSWLSNRYEGRKCRSLQYSTIRNECHLNSADHQDGSLQNVDSDGGYYWFPCYKTEHDVTNYVLNECRGLLPPPIQPNGADASASCFEVVNGYLIKGTAGGLEHDVSIEQCQCHCAHSQTSGRYAFQCQSATYYHQERDCVLNLDNRVNRTDLFDKNDKAAYTVSYMGMTCSPDRARAQFSTRAAEASNGIDEQVCGKLHGNTLVIRPVTSDTKFTLVTESSITGIGEVGRGNLIGGSTSSKSVDSVAGTDKHTSAPLPKGIALKPGVNSDRCFLELPHYVLEGMALAIESKITVEACKCYCIGAEKRYGGPCQSFQYYYDSKTCLLNRENRISNPDRFNVVPSLHLPHSYFDYRCAANGVVLSVYVDSTCEGLNIDVPIPKSEASFPVESPAVRYETTLTLSSSRTSGDAFVTAAPGDTEASMPSATVNLATAATPAASASAAIEGPEIILLVSEIPATLAPVVGISPVSNEHLLQNRQRFANPQVVLPEMEIHRSESSATLAPAPIAFEVKTPPFITAATVATTVLSTEVPSTTTVVTIESTTTTTTTTTETPSTEAITEHYTESSTGRTFQPVGPCRYSAIYETAFQGSKMVDRTLVTSPAQCFSACIELGCRSANLIQYKGILKHCELFRDSLIDYRTPDVLSFDSGTVYFDGIECSPKI